MLTPMEKRSLERSLIQAGLDRRAAVMAVAVANRHFSIAHDSRRQEMMVTLQLAKSTTVTVGA